MDAGAVDRFNETEGYNPRESNVLRMLGYFSLTGLQRVHTLVGDYHGALKAVHPLNFFQVPPHPLTPSGVYHGRDCETCVIHRSWHMR